MPTARTLTETEAVGWEPLPRPANGEEVGVGAAPPEPTPAGGTTELSPAAGQTREIANGGDAGSAVGAVVEAGGAAPARSSAPARPEAGGGEEREGAAARPVAPVVSSPPAVGAVAPAAMAGSLLLSSSSSSSSSPDGPLTAKASADAAILSGAGDPMEIEATAERAEGETKGGTEGASPDGGKVEILGSNRADAGCGAAKGDDEPVLRGQGSRRPAAADRSGVVKPSAADNNPMEAKAATERVGCGTDGGAPPDSGDDEVQFLGSTRAGGCRGAAAGADGEHASRGRESLASQGRESLYGTDSLGDGSVEMTLPPVLPQSAVTALSTHRKPATSSGPFLGPAAAAPTAGPFRTTPAMASAAAALSAGMRRPPPPPLPAASLVHPHKPPQVRSPTGPPFPPAHEMYPGVAGVAGIMPLPYNTVGMPGWSHAATANGMLGWSNAVSALNPAGRPNPIGPNLHPTPLPPSLLPAAPGAWQWAPQHNLRGAHTPPGKAIPLCAPLRQVVPPAPPAPQAAALQRIPVPSGKLSPASASMAAMASITSQPHAQQQPKAQQPPQAQPQQPQQPQQHPQVWEQTPQPMSKPQDGAPQATPHKEGAPQAAPRATPLFSDAVPGKARMPPPAGFTHVYPPAPSPHVRPLPAQQPATPPNNKSMPTATPQTLVGKPESCYTKDDIRCMLVAFSFHLNNNASWVAATAAQAQWDAAVRRAKRTKKLAKKKALKRKRSAPEMVVTASREGGEVKRGGERGEKLGMKAQECKHSAPEGVAMAPSGGGVVGRGGGRGGLMKPQEIFNGPAPDIGPGWVLRKYKRMNGASKGHEDRYWFSPKGKKFRSMVEITRFKKALTAVGGEDEDRAWNIFKRTKRLPVRNNCFHNGGSSIKAIGMRSGAGTWGSAG